IVRRLSVNALEESNRFLEIALPIVVSAQQVVQLPIHVLLSFVVKARKLSIGVLTNVSNDVRRLRQIGGKLSQPQQGLTKLQMRLIAGDLGKGVEAGLVKLQEVERLSQVELS